MKKIAFIGAGSFEFTRELAKDLLTFEAFNEIEFALMDIDEKRLGYITEAVKRLATLMDLPKVVVSPTTDRRTALEDADGVVITVLQGGVDVWRSDIEIPKSYGVDINVGDTRGPAGIFRVLRTIPLMMDIAKDISELCPKAIVLNYTNPMAMLCRAVQGKYPALNFTGLCHSVQSTARMLAEWLGVDIDEVSYLCAGINHQAFYLTFEHKGEDLYPRLRALIAKNEEIFNKEQVRNDMFLHLDYYVTESSGHNSEYLAWYRKRPDLLEKYCTNGTNWNPGHFAFIRDEYLKRQDSWEDGIKAWLASTAINLKRGKEYASCIFNASFGDGLPFTFNGNVRNMGYIDNLIPGCCVEIPVVVSKDGLVPSHVGSLPAHLAAINMTSAASEELAVRGALTGSKRDIYHAILLDPLTSAVLCPEEIEKMVEKMFEKNKDYLGYFK